MHELAICQALIIQVEDIARKHAADVEAIWIGVGPLSGVEPRLIERAYLLVAQGGRASEAQLHIQSLPVRVVCSSCGTHSDVTPNNLVCTACGDWRTTLLCGDELSLLRVQLLAPTSSHSIPRPAHV